MPAEAVESVFRVTEPITGRFNYVMVDAVSGRKLGEVQAQGVTLTDLLGDIGSTSLFIPLSDAPGAPSPERLMSWTHPAKTVVYVLLDGTPIWSGIVWGRKPSSTGITLGVQQFMSYWTRQQVEDKDLRFDDVDQLEIARVLLNQPLRKRNPLAVKLDWGNMSGVTRDRSYPWNSTEKIYSLVDNLSQVIKGFDYHATPRWSEEGKLETVITLAYPMLGRRDARTTTFSLPGNLIDYDFNEELGDFITATFAIGAGDGRAALRQYAESTALLDAGYLRLLDSYSYTDIVRNSTLLEHAQADLRLHSQLQEPIKVFTAIDRLPRFGSYTVGDYANILITDRIFPSRTPGEAGLSLKLRLVGWELNCDNGALALSFDSLVRGFGR